MLLPALFRLGREVFGSRHREGRGNARDAARKRHEPRLVQRQRESGQRPRELDQSIIQPQHDRTYVAQSHPAGQRRQLLPVTSLLRSYPHELLAFGIARIACRRAFLTLLHLPDHESPSQHPDHAHIPQNTFGIGSHRTARTASEDLAMPSFVLHDTQQRPSADRILFQSGQPAVNFAQGSLVPLQGQKVFCHRSPVCVVISPGASPAGEWRAYTPGSAKNLPNSDRTSAGRSFYLRVRKPEKNPSTPYCVFCRNIHPPVFSIHPKVFFMA